MKQHYSNWNAGIKKDCVSKTYDYTFERKSTVAYSDVENVIDRCLSNGSFTDLNDLYVKIINMTCRHTNHSGPNGHPSKKDRCAVAEKVLDKKKMKEIANQLNRDKTKKTVNKKYKTMYRCKRRKPQRPRTQAGIYRDPFKRKLSQFNTACNDGFFNGGCPFSILFNLHNIDDKAIVPAWLCKPPKIVWYCTRINLK